MLDANPRTHTKVKDIPALRAKPEDQVAVSNACERLMSIFFETTTLDEFRALFKANTKGAAGADLNAFCITLSKLKNF